MANSEGGAAAAMKDLIDKVNYDHLRKDMQAVKKDISNLTDHITDALQTVAGSAQKQTQEGYKQARSKIVSIVSDIGKQGNAAWGATQDAAATLEHKLEDTVQQRPFAAVGLALGLGFLIGMTWRR